MASKHQIAKNRKASGRPSKEETAMFTLGGCAHFAYVLSRETGWPMVALLRPCNDQFVADLARFQKGDRLRALRRREVEALYETKDGSLGIFNYNKIENLDGELSDDADWALLHVYCLAPDGTAVDVAGAVSEEDMVRRWTVEQGGNDRFAARELLGECDRTYLHDADFSDEESDDLAERAASLIGRAPKFFRVG